MWMNSIYTVGTHEPLVPIYTVESSKERRIQVDNHRTKLLPFDYDLVYELGKQYLGKKGGIQINCILNKLVLSAIQMSVLQSETVKDPQLQQLKEDIVKRKKCRKELISYLRGSVQHQWTEFVYQESNHSRKLQIASEFQGNCMEKSLGWLTKCTWVLTKLLL